MLIGRSDLGWLPQRRRRTYSNDKNKSGQVYPGLGPGWRGFSFVNCTDASTTSISLPGDQIA